MASLIDSQSIHSEFEVEKKGNMTIVKFLDTYVDKPPTEEQKEKLLQFDEEFKCRYTDDDEDYVANIKLGSINPPLVSSYMPFKYFRRNERGQTRKWEEATNYGDNRNCYKRRQDYNYNNHYRRQE